MIVQWCKPKLITIYGGTAKSPAKLRLVPGANDVADKDWDQIKGHKKVKKLMSEGKIKLMAKVESDDAQSSLSKIEDVGSCVKIVAETFDTNLLEKWKLSETRPPVVQALAKQLKDIEERTVKQPEG